MRLRVGTAELLLLVGGFIGLLEQEAVRVIFRIDPSLTISGICFVSILIGVGILTVKNLTGLKIGPLELSLREREDAEDDSLKAKQRNRRSRESDSAE